MKSFWAYSTGLFATAIFFVAPVNSAEFSTSYDYTRYKGEGIVVRTDPLGRKLQYHYDSVGNLQNLVLASAAGAPSLSYLYDETNQLSKISYPGGSQEFGYDDLDRVISIKDFNQPNLVTFDYDHKERMTWVGYPDGSRVCYQYDPDNRITRVGRVAAGQAANECGAQAVEKTDYIFDAKGRLEKIARPNGVESFVQYYADTKQIQMTGHRKGGELLASEEFVYVAGTTLYQSIIRTSGQSSRITNYQYDAYERLTVATEMDLGRRTEYRYDPFGNRTFEIITNVNDLIATGGTPKAYGTYEYRYDSGSNRLREIIFNGDTQQPLESFVYDNAGRLTQRTHRAKGTATYTFDDRGLLIRVNNADGSVVQFAYDALDVRKSKTVTGNGTSVTVQFVTASFGGLSHVLAEFTTSPASPTKSYIYAGHQQIAQVLGSGLEYLLHDGYVGSVTHATSATGNVLTQYDYDAFGVPYGPAIAGYGYTGEEYDSETALLYLRARYYDPTLGKFISGDPHWGIWKSR